MTTGLILSALVVAILAGFVYFARRAEHNADRADAAEKGLDHAQQANQVRSEVNALKPGDALAELRRRGAL